MARAPLNFLGYYLGSYGDCDGDPVSLTFYDWRPSSASDDIKIKIPPADGPMYLIIGLQDPSIVIVEAYFPDDGSRDPEKLVETSWREFIGHLT